MSSDEADIEDLSKKQYKTSVKKRKLYTKLLETMNPEKITEDKPDKRKGIDIKLGNTNAVKDTRTVEVSWYHNGISVRSPAGGGPRRFPFPKSSTIHDLLDKSKTLFFPEGISVRGLTASSCTFEMRDFSHSVISETKTETIEDNFKRVLPKGVLRYQMYTSGPKILVTSRTATTMNETDSEAPEISSSYDITSEIDTVFDATDPDNAGFANIISMPTIALDTTISNADETILSGGVEYMVPNRVEVDDTIQEPTLLHVYPSQQNIQINDPITQDMHLNVFQTEVQGEMLYQQGVHAYDNATSSNGVQVHVDVAQPENQRAAVAVTSEVPDAPFIQEIGGEVTITIHRSCILQELVTVFKSTEIFQSKLRFTLVNEKGVDVTGVTRDVYSTFWQEFALRRTRGEKERVPAHFEKYAEEEWRAIGRILCKGQMDVAYFPIQLSKAFVISLLFGKAAITPDVLWSSFLEFITQSEKDAVERSISNSKDEDDDDILEDLLCRMDCSYIPDMEQAGEFRSFLLGVAHKEIIQDSKFAMEEMAETAREYLLPFFPNIGTVIEFYETRKPTAKRIIKLLNMQDAKNSQEMKILSYLKLFIRSLDDQNLEEIYQIRNWI